MDPTHRSGTLPSITPRAPLPPSPPRGPPAPSPPLLPPTAEEHEFPSQIALHGALDQHEIERTLHRFRCGLGLQRPASRFELHRTYPNANTRAGRRSRTPRGPRGLATAGGRVSVGERKGTRRSRARALGHADSEEAVNGSEPRPRACPGAHHRCDGALNQHAPVRNMTSPCGTAHPTPAASIARSVSPPAPPPRSRSREPERTVSRVADSARGPCGARRRLPSCGGST
jgi:hypothetical protein